MPVPLCRCRVLYIGSAVPTVTKDGLQGIQQPLKERYPVNDSAETKGIDSWLSVWSNGILVEYIDGAKKTESAFYPITNLHYCAAVRYVNVTGFSIEGGGERFIPLDAPFANPPNSPHPPIFAAIFRRTTGVKVLECHAFICTNEKAANALVRCCFHSYADTISLKMEDTIPGLKAIKETSRSATPSSDQNMSDVGQTEDQAKDEADWNDRAIGQKTWQRRQQNGEYDTASLSCSVKAEGMLVPYDGHSARGQSQAGDFYEGNSFNRGNHPMMHPFFMPPPPPMGYRRGSAGSIPTHPPGFAAFRPPPQGMMPPPFMMPPPYHTRPRMEFMMPPPPPHIAARFGIPMPPPPFMPPPFRHPFFMMPPPHMMDRPKTPNEGPIITSAESVYDTFPRGGGNYEEPIYMPSQQSPPRPGRPESHDGYYEVYRRFHGDKKRPSRSDSDGSNDETQQYWDAYEARIYRQPHLNEKAFAESLSAKNAKDKKDNSPTPVDPNTTNGVPKKVDSNGRPRTPPADYDLNDLHISDQSEQHTQQLTAQQDMIVVALLGLISSTWALSLLDLHEDRIPIRTYSRDNLLDNDDGTISLTEYADIDYDMGHNSHSRSIPIIEAPVAMSNPIWKIFTRASDLYRIFRRSSKVHTTPVPKGPESGTQAPPMKKPMKKPRGWQLFLK